MCIEVYIYNKTLLDYNNKSHTNKTCTIMYLYDISTAMMRQRMQRLKIIHADTQIKKIVTRRRLAS